MNRKLIYITMLIGSILIFSGGWSLSKRIEKSKTQTILENYRKEKIKNSTLVKEKEGLYSKLLADTLTKKELIKEIDSLKIKVNNPLLSSKVEVRYKPIKKPIESVIIKDSVLSTVDYYPNKDNPFITYRSEINLKSKLNKGIFDLSNQNFNMVIDQNKDGTYKVSSTVPEYMTIGDIQVNSLPLEKVETKVDNFGFILGAGYGFDLDNEKKIIEVEGGIRYKKLQIATSINTESIGLLKLRFEL